VTHCVVPVYFDPSQRSKTKVNSQLLRFKTESSSGDVVIDKLQDLPTNGAYGVSQLTLPFCQAFCKQEMGREICRSVCAKRKTLFFIPCFVGDESPLYMWNEDKRMLDLVQRVSTSRAVSAGVFQHEPLGDWYVLVGQADEPANIYRWNGTALLREISLATLPKDTGGGSSLETMSTAGGLQYSGNGRIPVLLAASYGEGPSHLYSIRVERMEDLKTPIKLALHYATNTVQIYVACYGDSTIAVFEGQPSSTSSENFVPCKLEDNFNNTCGRSVVHCVVFTRYQRSCSAR